MVHQDRGIHDFSRELPNSMGYSAISVANMQLKLVDPFIDIGNGVCVEKPS